MNKLELIKRIADIEGIVAYDLNGSMYVKGNFGEAVNTFKDSRISKVLKLKILKKLEYNPFDWRVLGPLMLKHKAEVDMHGEDVTIYYNGKPGFTDVTFDGESDVPRAILECIVEANR